MNKFKWEVFPHEDGFVLAEAKQFLRIPGWRWNFLLLGNRAQREKLEEMAAVHNATS